MTVPEPPADKVVVPVLPVVRLPLTLTLSPVVPVVVTEMLPLLALTLPLSVSVPVDVKDTLPVLDVRLPLSVSVPPADSVKLPEVVVVAPSV